jgi:hypothetical protein
VGKRRKSRERRPRDVFVPRPFAGLVDEPEWIALRELVPAATAPLALRPEYGARRVTLATLLPVAWPAMVRPDGEILVGLQRQADSGDVNRDVAAAILAALETEPGGEEPVPVTVPVPPGPGPRLAEVLDDRELDVTVHDRFDFWGEGGELVKASMERANDTLYPTVRMAAARAAYWCRISDRTHLRWVLREPEDTALTALARLAAAGELKLRPESKFAGMFRAHGLLVPVWDLPTETEADEWDKPLADLAGRYADALTVTGPLDPAVRRARAGLVGRQLTLR